MTDITRLRKQLSKAWDLTYALRYAVLPPSPQDAARLDAALAGIEKAQGELFDFGGSVA